MSLFGSKNKMKGHGSQMILCHTQLFLKVTLTLRKYVHIHAGGHLSLSALEAVSKTLNFDKCAPKLFVEHCWAVEGQNLITLDVRFIVVFLGVS